jgi:hypothetical protein
MRTQTSHHKDARADDRAYAKGRQRNRAERTFQTVLPFFLGFRNDELEGFPPEEIRHTNGYSFICWLN